MHRQRLRKYSSLIMCFIFMLNIFLSAAPAYAAGKTIVLNGPDKSANMTFTATNMFPGDSVSQDYVLNISHKKDIAVMFRAKVREGYKELSEVLKLRVTVDGASKPLYDGLMKSTPDPITYTLPASRQSLTYQLTVYLDTSVGNKYQSKELKADFEWYFMPEEDDGGGSGGGDNGDDDDDDDDDGGNSGGNSGGGGGGGSGGGGGGGGGGGVIVPDDEPDTEPDDGEGTPDDGLTKILRRHYVVGRPNNYFEPNAPITRAETATIFARIFADYNEDNLVSTDSDFIDVLGTEWFAKYISRCEDEDIIYGHSGYFRPNDNITRAEFATICVRFYEARSGSKVVPKDIAFKDFDSSHWSYETIRKAYANGYITGYPDGTFRPDITISRAEAVTIVNRMLERIPDKVYIDNNLHKLIDFRDVQDNTYWAYYEIFEAANTHYVRFIDDFAHWVD